MENVVKVFENAEFGQIRTVEIDGEPWLVGKDVAMALGYANTRDALAKHVDGEDKKGVAICDTPGGKQTMAVINESGLYTLILGSKLPSAKRFKHWVTSEVLPSIRKTGAYQIKLTPMEEMARGLLAAQKLLEEQSNKIKELTPKGIFADAVAASETSILIGELAKLLKQNGVNIGQNRLFDWLRNNGYLMKKGSSRNMPTQKAMDLGLFEVKERALANPDGSTRLTRTTKVTGKGQQRLVNIFLAHMMPTVKA